MAQDPLLSHEWPESDQFVNSRTNSIWEYVKRVRSNEKLLRELGFSDCESLTDVLVLIRAGDRLHPTRGFDYLGSHWHQLDRKVVLAELDARDEAVEKIVGEILNGLVTDGYDSALKLARTLSPYQAVFISHTPEETRQCIARLDKLGLGRNELSDNLLEKRGQFLVVGFFEVLSYFMLDDL